MSPDHAVTPSLAPVVRCELTDGVLTVVLDSVRNRNALSSAVRTQLSEAFERAAADPAVRVVVLTHTGSAFCAGMDLKETPSRGTSAVGIRELAVLLRAIAHCPKPVVARVAGAARGGGIGILACCDIVVAARTATFAFSEVRVGLIPAIISVPVMARLAPAAVRELMLTGEVFDAARARSAGLVGRVVDPGALDAGVRRVVDSLYAGGPGALAALKELLSGRLDDSLARYAAVARLSAQQAATAEASEGAQAFADRRPPAWAGRTAPRPVAQPRSATTSRRTP